jgi:hypothetical protein
MAFFYDNDTKGPPASTLSFRSIPTTTKRRRPHGKELKPKRGTGSLDSRDNHSYFSWFIEDREFDPRLGNRL